MTLESLIFFLVAFAVGAFLAYWVITHFIPEPARTPALAIVGVLLLFVLLAVFFPGFGTTRLWR